MASRLPALAFLAGLTACSEEPEIADRHRALDLSVDAALVEAQKGAVAQTKVVTEEDDWYNPFDEEVSHREDSHLCFTSEATNPAPRANQFNEAKAAAEKATGQSVLATLWPALKDREGGTLTDLPSNLSTAVINLGVATLRCPTDEYYYQDSDHRLPVGAFVTDQGLALPPAFWAQNTTACERAGILAAATYCQENGSCAVVTTEGFAGNRNAELLRFVAQDLCKNAEQAVNRQARAMETRYGWDQNTRYAILGDTIVTAEGTAPVLGHPVEGTFKLLPSEPTKNCPVDGTAHMILAADKDGNETTGLDLQFANCYPDDTKPVILTVDGKSTQLEAYSAHGVDYNWYVCTKTNQGNCTHWTDYGLDATYGRWYSKKDHL